ncbi:hypothetical protein SDC9_197536 [bioreactor metagenome]|uniref:Uncharacterized protein n=1 Tax=bioreactor metagenome TaxID=1076179 RepID=A0A645IGE0_9ZZZZ
MSGNVCNLNESGGAIPYEDQGGDECFILDGQGVSGLARHDPQGWKKARGLWHGSSAHQGFEELRSPVADLLSSHVNCGYRDLRDFAQQIVIGAAQQRYLLRDMQSSQMRRINDLPATISVPSEDSCGFREIG